MGEQIGLSDKELIDQLKNIGININKSKQIISESQRKDLLNFLENKYSKKEKIIKNERWLTLKRKKITKINIKGKNTIIITKRNHTYVKSDPSLKKDIENEINNENYMKDKKKNIEKKKF